MATSNIKTIALTTPQKIEIVEAVLDQIRKQSIDVPNVEKVTDAEQIESLAAITPNGEVKRLDVWALNPPHNIYLIFETDSHSFQVPIAGDFPIANNTKDDFSDSYGYGYGDGSEMTSIWGVWDIDIIDIASENK